MLGDGHGHKRSFEPGDGRLIGGDHDNHRPAPASLVEVFFEKLPHFAASLADQGDDVYVRLRLACNHAQQRGLADAASGKNSQALAAAARSKSVNCLDAGAERLRNALSFQRVRRRQTQIDGVIGLDRPAVIQRMAQTVNNAAFQRFPDRYPQ